MFISELQYLEDSTPFSRAGTPLALASAKGVLWVKFTVDALQQPEAVARANIRALTYDHLYRAQQKTTVRQAGWAMAFWTD